MLENKRVRSHIAAALTSLLLMASTIPPALSGETAEEKLDVVRRVISERGEYDLAERQLKSFIEEYRGRPTAAEALVLLGYCQDKQRKNAEAAASYSRVLSEYPDAPQALKADAALGAADACFRLGRYRDAVGFYTTVLDVDAKTDQHENALLWRGEASYRLSMEETDAGRDPAALLADATRDFEEFLVRFPDSKLIPSALSGAAFATFDGGNYEAALAHFERAVRDFPSDRRAEESRYYVAESLYRLKRYDEARRVFKEVVADNPTGSFAADARAGEAWTDYNQRRVAEAAAGFEEAARLARNDREQALAYLYDAGCAWREAGDAQKAAQPFLEVAKSTDHALNSLAWFRLGTLWQEQARAARERADRAVTAPDREKYRELQKKLGEDAAQYFRRALAGGKLADEEIEARALLGEVLLDAGRFDEAAETFDEVAYRWPDSERAPWALYHQALAERELSQAAESESEKKDRLAKAADALRKSITYPEAKTRLQAAWALGDYLTILGDGDGAREHYRWLASDGIEWARAWRDARGQGDPTLENRAREYAADSLFRLGESYYFANDYPRAAGFYQEINNRHGNTPQSAMAHLRLGEIAEAGKDLATARSRYEESLKLGLQFGKNRVGTTIGYAQLRLGTLLLRAGQKESGETEKRRLLQEASRNLAAVLSDPPDGLNLARPYYYLAEAKYSLGQKPEALADYENALKADVTGELADASWFGVAWAKRDLGDAAGALEATAKVIADYPASPMRPDAFALQASIRRSEGDAAGALADLDRFLDEYADHPLAAKAELERASALDETGKHSEAAEAFQAFLRDHPDHPDVPQALYQRSWALWNRIKPSTQAMRDAEARVRDLTGGRPVEELAAADQAEAAKAEEDYRTLAAEVEKSEDEILTALHGLTERYPDYPVVDAAWLRVGEILYDRGDFAGALAAYQKSLAAAEARSSDLADKAQYRMAWSIQRLAEAAEADSLNDPDAKRRETARKDMWDRRVAAIDAFETIIGRYPKSDLVGDACFRAAELRRRSGQDNTDPAKRTAWFESAVQRYRQSLEKGGPDAPYRQAAEYGDGLCLLLDNKSAEAREVFRRLLLNPDGPYVQESYWGLGQANLNLGAYNDASASFEQALSVDKSTETAAKARYGLGMTAAMAGDNAKARLEFLAVDALYPQYPEWAATALVRAARIALEEGMSDRAIGDLERVLARYAETPAADEAREMQSAISSAQ
ncbi:MAG: tetratricopeptide repeat protein [Planctomycetaceae bacterium]|nr:tetratricopeptide repeat protein [Planctomycetaceae bacterium]